jgi:hypothetical protein
MSTEAKARSQKDGQLTEEAAKAALERYQELWNRQALSELLDGFTDDIAVEFADLPPIHGRAELERVLRARLVRQKGYRLQKTLRGVVGNTIVGSWVASCDRWRVGTIDEGKRH